MMRIHFTIWFAKCIRIALIVANYQVEYCQRYIPHRHNQPPSQDEATDETADNNVQRKQGNPTAQRASTWYKPEPHPMEAKGQPAENPEPQIVNSAVFYTGRFEDANQQGRTGHRYDTLSEKLKDHFFSRHSISPPGIHYNSCKFRRR